LVLVQVQVGEVELTRLFQPLPVQNVEHAAVESSEASLPEFLEGTVDVNGGDAEGIPDLGLVTGKSQELSRTKPTALMRTTISQNRWAIRANASRRPMLVIHSRKTAASMSVPRQSAAVIRGWRSQRWRKGSCWIKPTLDGVIVPRLLSRTRRCRL
jgi:hypothetical protein